MGNTVITLDYLESVQGTISKLINDTSISLLQILQLHWLYSCKVSFIIPPLYEIFLLAFFLSPEPLEPKIALPLMSQIP